MQLFTESLSMFEWAPSIFPLTLRSLSPHYTPPSSPFSPPLLLPFLLPLLLSVSLSFAEDLGGTERLMSQLLQEPTRNAF